MFRKHKYWLICAVVVAAAVVSLKLARRGHAPANIASGELAPALPGIVDGRLRVSAFGAGLSGSHTGHEPLRHISVYVNGPDYGGMEDNDMRGFFDGRYKHDWNQQGQIHVRPGRRVDGPASGEHELFRVPCRWDHIELPSNSMLCRAAVQINLERRPGAGLWLVLYELKKDYSHGQGGKEHDNVSSATSVDTRRSTLFVRA
jgi:hypothetical protein